MIARPARSLSAAAVSESPHMSGTKFSSMSVPLVRFERFGLNVTWQTCLAAEQAMGLFDTRGRPWDWSEYSAGALGDAGPWVWWLPLAWRAVADPSGGHRFPPEPRIVDRADADAHAYALAWWGPLLHLLFFGSGWVRPDLGLARWLDLGQPDEDPVLKVVKRWWGTQVVDVLAWSGWSPVMRYLSEQISEAAHAAIRPVSLPDRWADARRSPQWQSQWGGGGGDEMHLGNHATIALDNAPMPNDARPGARILVARDANGGPRAVLALPSYAGWYTTLSRVGSGLPTRVDGRSWRVEVVVRPMGWLGTYRYSRRTGRWFSGRHRWHELGLDRPLLSENRSPISAAFS